MSRPSTWHHVGLTVSDLDRSIAFYCYGLGFSVTSRATGINAAYAQTMVGVPGGCLDIVMLVHPDGRRLELVHYAVGEKEPAQFQPSSPGSGHLAFEVADIVACCSHLEQLGASFVSEIQEATDGLSTGDLMVYARDPDGAVVELVERRPDARPTNV